VLVQSTPGTGAWDKVLVWAPFSVVVYVSLSCDKDAALSAVGTL